MAPTEAAIRAHKLHELKKRAVLFYQANGVPEKIEEVLNQMFYDNPPDVFGYLSDFFLRNSGPAKLSRIVAFKSLDSRGVQALDINVFCTYQNKEQLFAQMTWPNEVWTADHSRQEDKDEEEKERSLFLDAAIPLLNDEFAPIILNECLVADDSRQIDILLQAKLSKLEEAASAARQAEGSPNGEDETTKESPREASGSRKGKSPKGGKKGGKEVVIIPDEPREVLLPGCNALGAISTALCMAGAKTALVPLYEHIHRLWSAESGAAPISMPLPLVTLLCAGKASPGKSNCVREYMIVPKAHVPLDKAIVDMTTAYRLLVKMQAAKLAPAAVLTNDIGALVINIERPELGLDMIVDALNQLDIKEDYNFVLNLAGHEIFDSDKGKYEVITGQQKLSEDLVEFYADLLNRYPQIIGLIDPMRKQESDAWMKLAERVSERCLIIGDRAFHRPGRLLEEELSPYFQTSGWLARLEQRTTISEIVDCAQKMRGHDNRLFLSSGVSDSCDTYIVDVAVGCQFDFIKLGAPCRGERIEKFRRLLSIWSDLAKSGRLAEARTEESARQFPKLEMPPPPAETDSASLMEPSGGTRKESVRKK